MSRLNRSFELADLIFKVAKHPTFISLIETDTQTGRGVRDVITSWAGAIKQKSLDSVLGPLKAYTLLAEGSVIGESITPLGRCEDPGGYRQNNLIASCAGWENKNIDLMFAILLHWSMRYETRFHHIGYKHISRANLDSAIVETLEETGIPNDVLTKPAKDHERYYISVPEREAPNGKYYVEHQLFENASTKGMHIDVATMDPSGLLRLIDSVVDVDFEIWDDGLNSPIGMVQTFDRDGSTFSIMARGSWTEVENW